jgi:AcrR family transcriptional regulator
MTVADVTPGGGPEVTDGRLVRGLRTRRRVAEALVMLLVEGNPEPTAREVAERAGVSLRLVFHHFDDMEDLYREVCLLQFERHWHDLPGVPPTLARPWRIERMLRQRSALFEDVGPVRRAGRRREDRSEGIRLVIEETNRRMRQETADTFAPELTAAGAGRVELLDSLDLLLSFETWDRLRRTQGLTPPAARRVLHRLLTAALPAAGGTGAVVAAVVS